MKPILVIGECCIDIYNYGKCERLAPDAPVPVLDITYTKKNWGMGGNVYQNIISLKFPCKFICNKNFNKITKTRYVDEHTNHIFIRTDSHTSIEKAKNLNRIKWNDYSAIVISDYNKGFLDELDISRIGLSHPLTFLDTKRILGSWAKSIRFIKINRKEYKLSIENINKFNLSSQIIETLGSDGCKYQNKIYPVKKVEVRDMCGAGDSFLAALAVKYVQTNDISKSLKFANSCATIVVQKIGVSVIKE